MVTAKPKAAPSIASGFCEAGNHARCRLEGCICLCHEPANPTPPTPPTRLKVGFKCLTGKHDACPGHHGHGQVVATPCGCPDPVHLMTDPPIEKLLEDTPAEAIKRRLIAAADQQHLAEEPAGIHNCSWSPPRRDGSAYTCRCGATMVDGVVTYPDGTLTESLPGIEVTELRDTITHEVIGTVRTSVVPVDPAPNVSVSWEGEVPDWPHAPYAGPLTPEERTELTRAMLAHDLPQLYRAVDQILEAQQRRTRDEWAGYFESWHGAVGPEPLDVARVIAALRSPGVPFGVAQRGPGDAS